MKARPLFCVAALVGLVTAHASPINLEAGLVAHLAFNGNTQDVTGNGNDGTIYGGLTWTADRFGNANSALQFDRNGYVQLANSTLLNGATSGAITGWFNNRLGANEYGFVVGSGDSRAGQDPFAIALNGDKLAQSIFSDATKGASAPDRYVGLTAPSDWVTLQQNEWTSFVMQFASIGGTSIFQLYLNGALAQEYVNPYYLQVNYDQAMPVQIGALTGFSDVQFRGDIDDVRFYNRALNNDEIGALNSVPDMGMTVLYLGMGLVWLAATRARKHSSIKGPISILS